MSFSMLIMLALWNTSVVIPPGPILDSLNNLSYTLALSYKK